VRGFRTTAIVFGAAIVGYGVLLLFAGEVQSAISAWLVGAGSILLVTWARGFPAREWLTTALLFVGIALVGSPVFALLILAAALVFQLWLSRRMRSRISPDFEVVERNEVMPGAEDAVAAFEAAGFRRTGAYATQVPRLRGTRRVVVSVLTGPERDRFAIATDRIAEVVSRFGDRWLLTINSGMAPLSADKLRQIVPRGSPADLAKAHQAALDILAGRGLTPDPLVDDDAVGAAFELERSAIAWASGLGMGKALGIEARRMTSNAVLRDDERSGRRVDEWLAADAPASIEG
jgi:hypothetical protein